MKFTVDFGMGMFNALNLGDVMNEMIHRVRPYEVNAGDTNRVFQSASDRLCAIMKERKPFEDHQDLPPWLAARVDHATNHVRDLS